MFSLNFLRGSKNSSKDNGFGLAACTTCSDKSNANPDVHQSCSKVDAQLAQMFGIAPSDPDFAAKLARGKRAAAAAGPS